MVWVFPAALIRRQISLHALAEGHCVRGLDAALRLFNAAHYERIDHVDVDLATMLARFLARSGEAQNVVGAEAHPPFTPIHRKSENPAPRSRLPVVTALADEEVQVAAVRVLAGARDLTLARVQSVDCHIDLDSFTRPFPR